jgi:hypothetical protein
MLFLFVKSQYVFLRKEFTYLVLMLIFLLNHWMFFVLIFSVSCMHWRTDQWYLHRNYGKIRLL